MVLFRVVYIVTNTFQSKFRLFSMSFKVPRGRTGPGEGSAGAVSEEVLRRAFAAVPKCQILSVKDLQHHLDSARVVLENDANDWDKRTKALQLVRSVVLGGGLNFEAELVTSVLDLEDALVTSVKDLRSQVCKEACITVCFLAVELGRHLVRLMDDILPHTLALVQNSAKVMATSGAQACDFIIKNVEHPTLLPIILGSTSHKSKEMRRQTVELINQVLTIWDPSTIKKHVIAIANVVENGISDADPSVRQAARTAYQQLEEKWPDHAQQIFKRLDASKQKALSGGLSAASSSQSITSLHDGMAVRKRLGGFGAARPAPSSAFLSGRSASAIDTKSAQRVAQSSPRVALPSRTGFSTASAFPRTPQTARGPRSAGLAGGSAGAGIREPAQPRLPPTRATADTGDDLNLSMNRLSVAGEDEEDFLLGDQFSGMSHRDAVLLKSLKSCSSANFVEKRDGLKGVLDLFNTGYSLRPENSERVTKMVDKMISDWNFKLIPLMMETISKLLISSSTTLSDWLPHLLSKLIWKHSVELIPNVKESVHQCLTMIRDNFDKTVLFHAMCTIIVDTPHQAPPPKVKQGYLSYLHEVLSGMESGVELNTDLVRRAVHKIFEWIEAPKNASFRMVNETVIVDLFTLNSADFSALLSTLPPAWKEFAFSLLSKTRTEENNLRGVGSPRVTPNVRRDVMSPSLASPARAHHVDVRRDVRMSPAMASPARAHHVDMHREVRMSPSVTSPARAHHVDGSGTRRMLGPIHSGNNSPTIQPANTKEKEGENDSFKETDCLLDKTIHLADDDLAQKTYVDELLEELTDMEAKPERSAEQVKALRQLHQMVSEGSLTSWEDTFRPLLVRIFECLTSQHTNIKRHAIRLLTKICMAQAVRFNEMTDLVLLKLFTAVADEDTQKNMMLMSAADDCMKVLATHLPAHLVIRTLNPIIHTASDPSMISALKMLERLIDTVEAEYLSSILNDITPTVIACCKNSVSSVRKVAVFALVAIVHRVGRDAVEHHLKSLDLKGRRVLEVYIQRREAAAARV